MPPACPSCSRPGLRPLGIGSERVEAAVKRLWPDARVRRMDSDTMRRREDYEETLSAFGRRDFDVLVGTQMIAKGLDFPRVTVVGIISPDQGLSMPDFRAAERTFQLIAQVAGRAGRGERPGRIVIQTCLPEEPAIALASRHDFEAFAAREGAVRKKLGHPPYSRQIRVVCEDEDGKRAEAEAERLVEEVRRAVAGGAEVLGPAPAAIALLRGRHRWNLMVRAPLAGDGLERARARLVELAATITRPQVAIDVDPVSML